MGPRSLQICRVLVGVCEHPGEKPLSDQEIMLKSKLPNKIHDFESQIFHLTSCVTWSTLLNVSMPQIPFVSNWDDSKTVGLASRQDEDRDSLAGIVSPIV